jgi:hypothetical protein
MGDHAVSQRTKPREIRLERRKGWRIPPNTIVVSRPSKWGNPYKAGDWSHKLGRRMTAAEAVAAYLARIAGNIWTSPNVREIQSELRGKNLACWCKLGEPCHRQVLLLIANSKGFQRGSIDSAECAALLARLHSSGPAVRRVRRRAK